MLICCAFRRRRRRRCSFISCFQWIVNKQCLLSLQRHDGRLVSVLVSAEYPRYRYHWYRPDTDTEYWYWSKPRCNTISRTLNADSFIFMNATYMHKYMCSICAVYIVPYNDSCFCTLWFGVPKTWQDRRVSLKPLTTWSNQTTSFEVWLANAYKGNCRLIVVITINSGYYNLGELKLRGYGQGQDMYFGRHMNNVRSLLQSLVDC